MIISGRRRGFLISILLLPVLFSICQAQTGRTIKGIITDSLTRRPLVGAHILIRESGTGVFTDGEGCFVLSGLPDGKVRLTISFVGYFTENRVIQPKNMQQVGLNIRMIPKIMEAAEVEITDNRFSQARLSVPMRMDIISAANISNTPGQNITAVLDYLPGVNLSTTMGSFSNNTVVTMRGLSGSDQGRTLVLLDEVPLNKADQGSVNWNLINRDNIDRIEISKGPGNAKYGSNAMGGVINIITRNPVKKISGTATLDYGTFNTAGIRYQVAGRIPLNNRRQQFVYGLQGFYRRSDGYNAEIPEYLEKSDTFYVNNFFREINIGGTIGYRFDSLNQVEVRTNFFNDKRGRGVQVYEVDGAYERHKTWQITGRYRGGTGKVRWDFLVWNQNENFERLNEAMNEGEYTLYLVRSDRIDQGARLQIKIPAGRIQNFTTGLEYQGGSVDGQDIYYTSTDVISNKGKMNTFAAFVQDEISLLNEKLTIIPGLRLNGAIFHDGSFRIDDPSYAIQYLVDYQDSLFPQKVWFQADPKLSLQYRFTPQSRIYLTFGRGFRAPNLDDLCRTGKMKNGFKIANPALKPEVLDNIEFGADLVLFEKIHLAPSIYYSIGRDFMYYVSTGDSVNMGYKLAPVFMKQNISSVDIAGFEFEADVNLFRWLDLSANYTFNHSVISHFTPYDTAVDKDLNGKFLTDVPAHKAAATLKFTNKYVNVNLLWKYVGSRWINDENGVDPYLETAKYPAYQTVGLRCWHTFFNHLTVALNADNLFDVIYVDDRLQQSPGRMITAELTVKF